MRRRLVRRYPVISLIYGKKIKIDESKQSIKRLQSPRRQSSGCYGREDLRVLSLAASEGVTDGHR